MANKKVQNMQFEGMLSELQGIVDKLEQGDLPLDEALKVFERGVTLTRASQEKLSTAQQHVAILTQQEQQPTLIDFDAPLYNQDIPS